MAAISRRKKVTDPLDDKMEARIFGSDRQYDAVYVSSGSEHSAQNGDVEEEQSPCLSYLLCGFLDELDTVAGEDRSLSEIDSDSDRDFDNSNNCICTDDLEVLNQAMLDETTDRFRNVLLAQVSKATEIFWFVKSNGSLLRRNVMAFLRSSGYNAGICKTKWESRGRLSAGTYEFIDVTRSDASGDGKVTRYFIDLDFSGEFEIARQTKQYEQLKRTLPSIFIGKGENLKQIAKVMSYGARRSLKSRGLLFPPWRKNQFMQNKWFGQYRRTLNLSPVESSSPAKQTVVVKCRSVGFDAVDGPSFFPATTRTR